MLLGVFLNSEKAKQSQQPPTKPAGELSVEITGRAHGVFVVWTGLVRASSLFPILSTVLLMMGGLCVGFGRIYSKRNNILLSAGILFVAAGRTLS